MEDTSYLTKTRFTEFALEPQLLKGLADAGFEYCTKIQAQSLPVALAGQDVAGQAQTGTGKTAAFLLAIFNYLLTHPRPASAGPLSTRAVVLAPTRELAIQIHRDAKVLGRATGLKLGLVYGGTGYQEQRETLAAGVDVLIGTPGRLIDYFKQQVFDLNAVQVLVLDEADRMFDLGFIKDIRYVLRRMPPPTERLNLLFSATLSHRVNELGYEHMNNPEEIKIDADVIVAERLLEEVYYPANTEKLPLLLGLMRQTAGGRVLVFSNMRVTCDRLGRALKQQGYTTGVLSGDVPQQKREQLLNAFKEGKRQVLVATDVAARGLHIPSVSHVINYDLPQDAEDYVHRIGRTARAGASGHAISF
ncbi:MAG: DEAD/DEAH box helicase, partial [Arenicellales bacterium]|nr:DEAD/DEAH box helicase [Arenicellales bacterium]